MHVYFSTRRGNSGRFSATELLQFCVTAGVVVAPDRDFPVIVFWNLRRFLHFGENRVEMRLARPNPSQTALWASRIEMVILGDQ
jgi:hypothetical protein